jgi:putative ABC transport system permease protein
MIASYFKIAWRNLLRSKLFSSINVIGLAFGIAVSLLMLIHIRHELSYETFYPDHDLIYRVASVHWAKTPPSLKPALEQDMPEMSVIGRFYREGPKVLANSSKQIPTQNNYLIDPSILSVFNFKFIYGNPAKALSEPSSIILTRDVADKFFPGINPIGQALKVDDWKDYTITGIIENIPSNSHLKIEMLTSIAGTDPDLNRSRSWHAVDTYVRFRSVSEMQQASQKLRSFQYRFQSGEMSKDDIDRAGDYLELHPLSDIHLYSHREKEMGRNSDIQYIYLFVILSVFIILVASINFINLFTAQSVKRMKEIGVKKVVGASRKQLIQQFLCETFLMTLASALLALIIAETMLPFYNHLSGLALATTDLFERSNILILTCITLLVAILSGLYPALVISNYKIAESLKSRYSPRGNSFLRKVLVTFQFVISALVIIVTGIVFQQMQYIQNRDLGFSQESVVTIRLFGSLAKNLKENKETLKNELLRNHNIKSVSVSTKIIGERFGYEYFHVAGGREADGIDARFIRADEGFVPTLGLRLIEGRNFLPGDTAVSYILNEEAAKLFHEKELVGKPGGYSSDEPLGKIVGIVKNFNFASLHSEIEPLVIECRPIWPHNLLIKINNAEDSGATLAYIKKVISEFTPGSLVIFNFLDDQLNLLYETENNIFAIFQVFSLLSVIIATLGLLALSAHTVESRVKEIGIRKVLGATIPNIILMLTNDYMRLVAIACILSIPVAYYVADLWLVAFAYRITMNSWMFILPGIILIMFTLLVVSAQSLKAAMTDPVKSLRYE